METISATVLLCHNKHSSGRHKRSSVGSVSEAALHCRNLKMYVCTSPALFRRSLPLLRKKPSDSQKKLSDLRRSCTANTFWKNIQNVGIIFFWMRTAGAPERAKHSWGESYVLPRILF